MKYKVVYVVQKTLWIEYTTNVIDAIKFQKFLAYLDVNSTITRLV